MDKNIELAIRIATKVAKEGGDTYFVGGCVRDELLGIRSNDIDIEVHGLSENQLKKILATEGNVLSFGQSFQIYHVQGYRLDISLPRDVSDRNKPDPFVGTYQAAKRRDFTINALMKNVLTGDILDYFHGQQDLKQGILDYIDEKSFLQDPLRLMRGCQLAARYRLQMSERLLQLCGSMDITNLPSERINEEVKKALLKSDKPSLFFEWLRRMNQLSYWFKELNDLIGVPQNPKYHAEGDVFVHTMMVVDQGATLREQTEKPYEFMLSCLCHDFGKAVTTVNENGSIHSYRHEIEGVPLVKSFISRLTTDEHINKYVSNMTLMHMRPSSNYRADASIKATNKMYYHVSSPNDLVYLSIADTSGKIPMKTDLQQQINFLFERYEVYKEYMTRPYVSGKDLQAMGIVPNENYKELLKIALQLRLSGVHKENALKQIQRYAKQMGML